MANRPPTITGAFVMSTPAGDLRDGLGLQGADCEIERPGDQRVGRVHDIGLKQNRRGGEAEAPAIGNVSIVRGRIVDNEQAPGAIGVGVLENGKCHHGI